MPSVNVVRWLAAVGASADLIDTDLVVATVLAYSDTASVEGLDPETVADSVQELICAGFLEPVLVSSDPVQGTEEHLLELRLPA